MTNALERLQGFVANEIEPLSKRHLTEEKRQTLLSEAARDCKLILQYLSYKAVRTPHPEGFSFLVDKYQRALVKLSDCVYRYQQRHPEHSLQSVYSYLLSCFGKTLRLIAQRYPVHFNPECKAPDVQQAELRGWLELHWEGLARTLKEEGAEAGLLKIVSTPVAFFLKSERTDLVSYRWLLYIRSLKDQLVVWVTEPHGDITWELMELLFLLNFNGRSFGRYCIDFIIERMDTTGTARDKLDLLCRFRRKLYPLHADTPQRYYKNEPGMKEMLDKWLGDEISVLERMHPMYYTGDNGSNRGTPVLSDEEWTRFLTVFSEPQLLFFLRLHYDAGIFIGENLNRICKKISHIFRTKKAELISLDSLKSKMYTPSENAIEVVGGYIIEMHNRVMMYRKKMGMRMRGRQ